MAEYEEEYTKHQSETVSCKMILNKIKSMGYQEIEIRRFPAQAGAYTDSCDWYCVIVKKG